MNYIDPAKYNELLKNFAKGTPKQVLQENYVDMRPINAFEGVATAMSSVYKQYDNATSMEEKAGLSPKQKKIAAMAPPTDKITGADFAAMKAGKKEEGIHLGHETGPTVQTVEGMSLGNLTVEEQKELKAYVESIKTTKKAIQELLQKAKSPKMEGGDTTGKEIQVGQQNQPAPQDQAPEEENN